MSSLLVHVLMCVRAARAGKAKKFDTHTKGLAKFIEIKGKSKDGTGNKVAIGNGAVDDKTNANITCNINNNDHATSATHGPSLPFFQPLA